MAAALPDHQGRTVWGAQPGESRLVMACVSELLGLYLLQAPVIWQGLGGHGLATAPQHLRGGVLPGAAQLVE